MPETPAYVVDATGESGPVAIAFWRRWWAEPDLVRRMIAALIEQVGRSDPAGVVTSGSVRVRDDVEVLSDAAAFPEGLTHQALREWHAITIESQGAEGRAWLEIMRPHRGAAANHPQDHRATCVTLGIVVNEQDDATAA